MTRVWRTLVQPSLVRRLTLAQLLTLAAVWFAAVSFFAYDAARNDDAYDPKLLAQRAEMVLAVVDGLADRPSELQQALKKIDRFQRGETGEDDHPATRITMNVWLADRLIFVSPGRPGQVRAQRQGELERVYADGAQWRTYNQSSATSTARVTLIRAGDTPLVLLSLTSRRLLVLPLVMSLPLLLAPAWLSVRVALRPWRQLSREVESRAADDLSPLKFQARHRELRPLSRAIDKLLDRVRDGMQRERSFIADAAHELRTPLAAMRIHVEALQRRARADEDQALLDGLGRSSERASRLVAQLLALMRSDARRASQKLIDLSLVELAQERLAAMAPLAGERDIELEFWSEHEVRLAGEREGLTSLLDNLIENAIKYSPAGGTVRVSVRHRERRLELAVEDEGPGIEPDQRERVFDRFFRAPGQTQPGSGLGLAIVRSVAERHGAEVHLGDNENGPGLRVTVIIPAPADL